MVYCANTPPTLIQHSSSQDQLGSTGGLPSSAVNWSLAGPRSRSGRAGRRGGWSQQTGRSRRCSGRKEGQGAGRAGPRLATDWARARAGGPAVLHQATHIHISQHFFCLLILAKQTCLLNASRIFLLRLRLRLGLRGLSSSCSPCCSPCTHSSSSSIPRLIWGRS